MATYKFVISRMYGKLSADAAAEELNRIREKYGELRPEYVVNESEKKGSVLHEIFEWNDTKAAALYRKEQARNLIKNIVVVVNNETVSYNVRAFVNVRPAEDAPREYMPLQEAIENKDAYDDLLSQAKSDMEAFVDKYRQIEELNPVKAEMLKVLVA